MKQLTVRNILPFFLLTLLWVAMAAPVAAQDVRTTTAKDSARVAEQRRRLGVVVVSSIHRPSATLSTAPVQVAEIEKLERTGALQLSDAVKQMAGVTLKDYGGVGGMKTISARGLGSQFSTLTIDGVAVNDAQNGQVDLGRYMIGNSAYVSLSNGQQDEMLLSARATAAGSVLNMETQDPRFLPGEKNHGRIGLEGGSFGMLSPTLAWERRLGRRLSMTLWTNWLQSRGDYPFVMTTGSGLQPVEARRDHSAMHMGTADANFFFHIDDKHRFTAKVHYVQGRHELPGPVVLYTQKGTENTEEKLFFTQAKYLTRRWQRLTLQIIGKYQYTYDLYEDHDAITASGYQMSQYSQQEGYLSGTAVWKPLRGLSLSLAADEALTSLNSSMATNSNVLRSTLLTTAAAKYHHGRFDLKGNLLATIVDEDACDISETNRYRKLSPFAGLSVRPFAKSQLHLRYFFKDTYRVPNFNEMYYFVTPLDTLRPECATQHNVGITLPLAMRYSSDSTQHRQYSLTIDAYHNSVKDKIIAVPRQNMFFWSTMNLGLVKINGLDMKCTFDWIWPHYELNATATYSLQQARDFTNPDNPKRYKHQIPYTPLHSGGITLYLKTRVLNAGYSIMIVGERYWSQQNKESTRLPAYADHGISVDRSFELPIGELRVMAQVQNLLDVQYEVVRSYPMMGRNFRVKVSYEF